MGSSSSKQNAAEPSEINDSAKSSSSSPFVRRSRSSRSRVFQASCLRSQHSEINEPQVSACESGEIGKNVDRVSVIKSESESECCLSDKVNLDWAETNIPQAGSSSRAFASPSRLLNPTSRLLASCSFYPGNLSFQLSRSSSLGSSTSNAVSNDGTVNGNERSRGCDFFPGCFSNRPPTVQHGDLPATATTNFFDDIHRSRQNSLIDRVETQTECSLNLFSPGNNSNIEVEGSGQGHCDNQNVQFSRTLSVGRLRDRVVRRSSVPDIGLNPFQPDRGVVSGRQDLGHEENAPLSTISSSSQTSSGRHATYRDLLEHRSNFLERRRRIRSQVRALQRLGSRFENFSGHERSCILSGQHRTGRCACHVASPNDDNTNARASISRIVMLAEALFEVLDEIQQQSVVLSSRPSVSSIGSIPAPIDVVESLPLKQVIKGKRRLTEEVAQCYICLVEYEEGDSARTLPCQHEFHTTCIDKWLKEIHGVCPLCRWDVCSSRPNPFINGVDASL